MTTSEKRLSKNIDYYLWLSDQLIALGLMSTILFFKLEFDVYFPTLDLYDPATVWPALETGFADFFLEKGPIALLSGATMYWFVCYRSAVHKEAKILKSLYTEEREPHDWDKIGGGQFVPLLALGLVAFFVILAWFVDRPSIFCLVMAGLWIQDMIGNGILRRNLIRYFKDKAVTPQPEDPMAPVIARRRAAAQLYWIDRPQTERIATMLVLTLAVFYATTVPAWDTYILADWGYAFALAVLIIVNQFICQHWRAVRNAELRAADDQVATLNTQIAADSAA